MRSENVTFLILNNNLIIKQNEEIEILSLDDNVIKNGRINNIKNFITIFNKAKIIKNSNKKIAGDNFHFIYFAEYTELELTTIKNFFKDYGYDKLKAVNFANLLSFPRSTMYFVKDIEQIYIYTINNFMDINSKLYENNKDDFFKMLIKNFNFKELLLLGYRDLEYFKDVENKYQKKCYILDDDITFIFNLLSKRN